ncbi:unnamed protein product [Lota lota]
MELNVCPAPVLFGESSLDKWEVIGSGGFGQIFKARHVQWVWDVAIKVLHYDNGSSSALLREAELMRRGESPYVVRVSGVFRGRLPSAGPSVHLGLVMDYMEQGSMADLQGILCGPPPWPLAFRLPYQVALGMNFLHTLSPPLLHLDLKPSNVLLDTGLNVKLTDFGLARIYQSVSRKSKVDISEEGGTTSYMPPEAFRMDYTPTCASDMYSYGILLWSILSGKKPYTNALSSLVRLRIPEGDRPPLDDIDPGKAEGLGPLVEMMGRCWDNVPKQRPSFMDCISVTEKAYDIHKSGINSAVHYMQALLEKRKEEGKISDGLTKLHITQPCWFFIRSITKHICTDMAAVSPVTLKQAPEKQPEATVRPTAPGSYQVNCLPLSLLLLIRQRSNPEPAPVYINKSNVSWFQNGNSNYMHISTSEVSAERRRHPTAPPRFNPQSHKRQTAKH